MLHCLSCLLCSVVLRIAVCCSLKRFVLQELSVGLLTNMYNDKIDFTTTFRSLASVSADDEAGTIPAPLAKVCFVKPLAVHKYV